MSGEMNISFGGQKKITANHQNMNGIKQGAFKTDKDKAIFNKFDKDKNGVLDRQELLEMVVKMRDCAGGDNQVMSKKEMTAFLKAQGFSDDEIKNIKREDLYNFVNTVAEDKDGVTEAKWDGNTFIQEENGSRIETKYRDDEHKIKESATVTNDQGTLTELYDEAGDLSQIITKHGAITTTHDKDNKILKQVKDMGNDLQEITEFEYGEDGKLVQKKVTGHDGTVKVFDKDGKEIVQEEPQQTTQAKLQEKFGDAGKVSVTVDGGGSVPKISRGDYAGEIRLPNGAQIEDGKFPEQLRMTLPDDYKNRGNNGADPVMKLTLIDPENGVYETTGGKRNFQVQVNEDGSVYVKSVAVGEFPKAASDAAAQAGAAADSAEAAVQQAGDQGAQQVGDAGAKVADDAAAEEVAADVASEETTEVTESEAASKTQGAREAEQSTVQQTKSQPMTDEQLQEYLAQDEIYQGFKSEESRIDARMREIETKLGFTRGGSDHLAKLLGSEYYEQYTNDEFNLIRCQNELPLYEKFMKEWQNGAKAAFTYNNVIHLNCEQITLSNGQRAYKSDQGTFYPGRGGFPDLDNKVPDELL